MHEFGLCAEIATFKKIAAKYNLKIIDNIAYVLGAGENRKLVGSYGDTGSFSFHPGKATTEEKGGVINFYKK